jgi:hypothetical protein
MNHAIPAGERVKVALTDKTVQYGRLYSDYDGTTAVYLCGYGSDRSKVGMIIPAGRVSSVRIGGHG